MKSRLIIHLTKYFISLYKYNKFYRKTSIIIQYFTYVLLFSYG